MNSSFKYSNFKFVVACDERDEAALGANAKRDAARRGFAWANVRFASQAPREIAREIKAAASAAGEFDSRKIVAAYSRNEQSGAAIAAVNAALECGYTSFSAIDSENDSVRCAQTRACFKDLLSRSARPPFKSSAALKVKAESKTKRSAEEKEKTEKMEKTEKTFSLVFDVEQLACARVALPRVLALLARSRTPATFFCTGFVLEKYSGLARALRALGHEVALHGMAHEYLAGASLEAQSRAIANAARQARDCGVGAARGANFIGRMDARTVEAFARNGLRYFLFPLKNTRRLLSSYSPPLLVETRSGTARIVPVQVETYGKTRAQIRAQIENSVAAARKRGFERVHLTVLCHPFYDGALRNLPNLRALLEFLDGEGFKPTLLNEAVSAFSERARGSKSEKVFLEFSVSPARGKLRALLQRLKNNRAVDAAAKAFSRGAAPVLKVV